MKKLLFFASALAGLFLAASCQQENLEPVGGNTVTYTVQVPGALSTKAIGTDVAAVTELIYEVYRIDEQGTETKLYQKSEIRDAASGEKNWTVELELVNNQDFRVLFWAQVPENGVYTTTSLKEVKLATALNANAENYAAFAGQDEITYGENLAGRTVTLVRPVAQLNIATSAESLKLGEDENGANAQTTVTVETTAVTVEGLSTVYNVAEGAAGADEATFTYAANPVALSETTLNVNGVDYAYVAMNYVGFAQPTGDNVTVTYTINTENVGTITNKISSVPVKANHRTNIIGNLITSTSDYTVTLSATWPTDEENVEVVAVSTAADLQEAINAIPDGVEGNITLEGNIDLVSTKAGSQSPGLNIPAGKSVTLDLNGYTLKQELECAGSYSMIVNNGTLTITGNGKVSFKDLSAGGGSTWGSYTIENHGTLIVENGTIEHLGDASLKNNTNIPIQNYAGKVVVNDGIISSPTFRSLRDFTAGGEIIINGGQFLGQVWMQGLGTGSSSLTINGGEFNPTAGYDGSSVYITNGTNDVQVSITGGTFNTKIGCADSNKSGVKGCITGGTFAVDPSEYVAEGYGVAANENGTFTVEKLPTAAKIGDTEYLKLAEAVNNVKEGETITILEGTIEEGTIKLPASLKNVTFKGEEGAILKDMTIMACDGNSISYERLTFDGLTLDNSRISITGWRTNGAVVKNFTVTNCIFRNLDDNTNSAPVHINMAATEPVNGFIFTNNVIDGATGGSKSGIYAQVTGEVLVSGNIINNVAFRPYVIQVTTDDNIADNFVVTNNTFSGSAAGRAQGLGNNAEGTDAVNIVVTENIFKGITDAQQICYWNFNDATTEFDLSGNYYDIDILANPSRIYYNGAASGLADLIAKNIFPIYTELNADGTINKDSAYSPVPVAKVGDTEYYSLQEALNAGNDIVLLSDAIMAESYSASDAEFTLNGNGYTISQAADCKNEYALFDITGGKISLSNVVFDGIKGGAVVRTVGAEFNADNVTAKNGNHTQVQGLFRLMGKSTITNCTFEDNNCNMVITLNYDGANNDPQLVENCVFENNTCNATAVLYYVKGAGATIHSNKFIGNTVNCNTNGATVYMGFTENNVITNNLFENNIVNESATSKRVAGGLMLGYEAVVTGNAFIGNTVTGTNAKGNDVCASVYYTDIDLSGNYWGGNAPVENDDYFVEYPDNHRVIINNYLTENPIK